MVRSTISLARRIGKRGTALLFFALLDVIYAISLANPPAEQRRTASLLYIESLAPLEAWAFLWLAVGLVLAVGAFCRRDRWAFASAMFLKVLWGTTHLVGWAFYGVERGYVSAIIWLTFAVFVYVISTWPEPPELLHISDEAV